MSSQITTAMADVSSKKQHGQRDTALLADTGHSHRHCHHWTLDTAEGTAITGCHWHCWLWTLDINIAGINPNYRLLWVMFHTQRHRTVWAEQHSPCLFISVWEITRMCRKFTEMHITKKNALVPIILPESKLIFSFYFSWTFGWKFPHKYLCFLAFVKRRAMILPKLGQTEREVRILIFKKGSLWKIKAPLSSCFRVNTTVVVMIFKWL